MAVVKRYIDGEWVPVVIGRDGVAATIALGSVSELGPDTTPTVANSGTSAAAVFDFGLPRAPSFTVGTVSTGAPESSVSITDVGTGGDIVLDFSIPKGDKGDTGDGLPATTPNDGDVLVYDGTAGNWVAATNVAYLA